jgi:TonB family protein
MTARGCPWQRLAWLLVLAAGVLLAAPPVSGQEDEEQVVPLAPIDVTARYPLTPPEPRKLSKPAYPEAARRREEQGTVLLAVKVLADGNVGEVSVKKGSGSKPLDDAAVAEARSWQFVPGRRGPTKVESWVEVPVRFQLSDQP